MYPLLQEKSIPTRVKVLIYKTILRPLLTYGSEIWTLTTKLKSKIQAAEMRVLRLIKGITRRDRKRNADVQKELGMEPILTFVERSQLRWYGHVMRMDIERYPLKVLPLGTERDKAKRETQEKMEGWNQRSNRNERRDNRDDRR